jgi:hypothetical protein
VNVHLVQLPVTVTGRDGKSLDNLPKSSFQVYEDNVLQEISLFKHEDIPISIGLVIDNSGTIRRRCLSSRMAKTTRASTESTN